MANQEQLNSLKQGVEIWNQWRQKYSGVEVDLTGANLGSANLRGADLTGADLTDATLRDAILTGADLTGATLRDADLRGTDLSSADLRRADLSGANLRRANLCHTDLSHTDLSCADLSCADLSGADLYYVNFSDANLSGIDLSGDKLSKMGLSIADLMGVNLMGVNLSRIDLSWIDLSNINLRYVDLSEIDFRGANLSGIDLSDDLRDIDLRYINLSDTDLHSANLSGINLNGVNLSNANLSAVDFTRTQALATNFTGAILTGACLEDWNINSETKLDGVICEYVYLKQNQQERRPSSGIFKTGEFTALFQKALETVDLIFADGIDWQAFVQSFQELRLRYDNENLSIQAIEKKSGGAFVIRLEVPPEADNAAIEQQAKQLYEMKLQLLETQYRAELHAKDREIEIYKQQSTNMLEIVKLQASRPINPIAIAGSQSMGDRNIHMGSGNYNERIEGNYIQGNYTNMSQDLTQAAQQIQNLLQQLQNQGVTVEDSQKQVATQMAKQAETDPSMMGKLVLWSKAMANKASETTVSEAAKMVFTLALKAAGLA